jgi:cold shock CspA family protein
VDPYGWHYASHQFAPLIETKTLANTNFIPDALNTVIFDITYNGTVSISAPKNMSNGRTITICLRQGEGGNHRLEWDPIFHFDGGYKFITETEGSKDVMVGTKINDFIFSTLASDCKNSDSTVLGSSSVITY